ncbi:MAG: MFS transporter [Hyphomicrobium sp.]|uniref:MFS transporter n=1 Tax=Hyphomicrobium sp. TaxID=82 RepID=UPI0039E2AD0A
MSSKDPTRGSGIAVSEPSTVLIACIAVATGALVANIYYAQPLIDIIGREFRIPAHLAGSLTGITQIGYGAGLFFLVSLADLVENKRLVLVNLTLTTIALVWAASANSAFSFFLASFFIGLCSTSVQILVPYISHFVPDAKRGRIVGNVMAGLLAGIMLARPVALIISAHFGWRAIFLWSALLMVGIGLALLRLMPRRQPPKSERYFRILQSMVGLLRKNASLRRRSFYQSSMFCVFNLFWTAAPIMLTRQFGLSSHGIALFALAGAGGALAAPIVGQMADRGMTRILTIGAMTALGLTSYAAGLASYFHWLTALIILTVAFDAAVQANQITSSTHRILGPSRI